MAIATANSGEKWKKVIKKQMGKPDFVQLKSFTAGSVDPNTGEWTEGGETITNIDAVVTSYDESLGSDSNIRLGDKKVVAAYDCGYSQGDYILIGGVQYSVINPNPINPNGYLQAYEMQVRIS